MNPEAELIVRRTERHEIALPARFAVAEPHRACLRYTPAIARHDGWVDCDLVDLSGGGLGLIATVFVPRMARLTVRIYRHEERRRPILEVPVRVQRTVMTDRRPAYLVGTAFDDLGPETASRVDALLDQLDGSEPAMEF